MRLTTFSVALIVSGFVSVLGGLGSLSCHAQGVSVTPLRVLFDGRTRSTTVFLSNRSSEPNTYRISLVNMRMLEDGDIVAADEAGPGEFFADDIISFSPRRVTIPPQSAQTIRLLVRRPRGDVPDDVEFRTHMSIRSIPPTPRLEDIETAERLEEEELLSVQPVVTVETVIPILVRFGKTDAGVAIENPKLVLDDPDLGFPLLTVEMRRTGSRSIYGDVDVFHTAPDGTEQQIFMSRGLAVYAPLDMRVNRIRLRGVDPDLLRSGSLRVVYTETADMHGDQVAELVIPLDMGVVGTQ